jgi:uncharacterized iron-regulated membrane protein
MLRHTDMGAGRHPVYTDGPHTRSTRTYRGSRKRLRRLKWYKHSSIEFWLFLVIVLFLLFVGVPWMINHPEAGHHRPSSSPMAIPNP